MAMMGSGSAGGEDRAREAAEAAISSPLLEDINLQGARGILVNVTAGMDLAIGEFQAVGDTIKEYASDDATVVVGTVIDPDMSNNIRVTVVATGLGQAVEMQAVPPLSIVEQAATGTEAAAPNYGEFESPTKVRKQETVDKAVPAQPEFDLLDIPAFLRRQAD
jgi:cell division protein FtsZ